MGDFSITDELLVQKFKTLPSDYWDFKDEDTKELTHGIHTYPAVMVYPISRKLIEIMSEFQPINSLLDPFMGSGTVLVEAMLAGYGSIYGADLNPLAKLITKVKTTILSPQTLNKRLEEFSNNIKQHKQAMSDIISGIDDYIQKTKLLDITAKNGWGSDAPAYIREYLSSISHEMDISCFKNIGYWFKPSVIIELQMIKDLITLIDDEDIKDFVFVAFSETLRLVSNRRNGEFKMFRMPADKIKKHNPLVTAEFDKIFKHNTQKMMDFFDQCELLNPTPSVHIAVEDARMLNSVPNNSIDLMITSPPYGDSRTTVAYGEFSRLSLQWLDIYGQKPDDATKLDKQLMGGTKFRNGFEYNLKSPTLKSSLEKIKEVDLERAGDVYSFYKDLNDSIRAIASKMRKNTYQFWVVGNRTVKLETLLTDRIVAELGAQYGLKHIYTIPRNIPNKVMPSLNSPTNVAGDKVSTMTNEHIVILRKV
jgi:DNA modification methylase